jgi:hypothetical protein
MLSIKGMNIEAVVIFDENSVNIVTIKPAIIRKVQSGM